MEIIKIVNVVVNRYTTQQLSRCPKLSGMLKNERIKNCAFLQFQSDTFAPWLYLDAIKTQKLKYEIST